MGNWKTRSDASSAANRIATSMAVRYDDTRMQLAARAKVTVLSAVRSALEAARTLEVPWSRLPMLLPDLETVRKQAAAAGMGLGRSEHCDADSHASSKPFPLLPAVQADAPPCQLETGAASSGDISDGERVDELAVLLAEFQNLHWCCLELDKKNKIHEVLEITPEKVVAVCKRKLRRNCYADIGLVSALRQPLEWCSGCRHYQPDNLRTYLMSLS